MTGRDPAVRPVPGDIIQSSAGVEYRVQDVQDSRVYVCDAETGRREWVYRGQWMAMALRGGTVLHRGDATQHNGGNDES